MGKSVIGHVNDVRGGELGGLDDAQDAEVAEVAKDSCDASSMGDEEETEEAEEVGRDSADNEDASNESGRRRPGKRFAKVAFCNSSSSAMDLECHDSYNSSPRK